ncbi:MAG: redox-regulated ATPase YchF [Firmicutes bacterium]|nr:redox-regulated ATPase YchF [Bacillota bacterium]
MKLGIVGLPNSGKTTLYNAIMQTEMETSNYPFTTTTPNIGRALVPDGRLEKLREMYKPKAVTPATVEMVDIAGLAKGASQGEGMGNQFLAHIREVDAIVHVVRCFIDENVIHIYETVDPVRDIETVDLELIFADLEMIERRLTKVAKTARTDKTYQREADILTKIKETLENGKAARTITWSDPDDLKMVESFTLITQKPVLYAANVSDDELGEIAPGTPLDALKQYAEAEKASFYVSCAKMEAEIAMLDPEEKQMFLEDLGLAESGLDRLIKAGYEMLGLISFLTAGEKEVRAWTVRRNTKAPNAAGKIHSDLERGFIRAEVVAFTDLMECGSYNTAKEKGLVRVEGKEYVVQDGDVLLIRFNV